MKRWAVLIVLAYMLILLALAAPAIFFCLGNWWGKPNNVHFHEALTIYGQWGFWLWLGIMALSEALLLFVPVRIGDESFPPRRPLWVPILVTGFFLGMLLISGVFAALCAIFRDDAFGIFTVVNKLAGVREDQNPSLWDFNMWLAIGMIVVVFWAVWGFIFYRFAKADDPDALVKRATRWLIRGSVLELLVAVPSHIIVRHRDDCCAPGGTFWGITTGVSIMFLAFGPGVFFLFAERMRQMRPKKPAPPAPVSSAA